MTGKPDDVASSSDASASKSASAAGTVSREISIVNKRGLHARASAKFVQMVERFNADVSVTRNGETVGGNSIMGLMMLSAGIGTTITVSATGPAAEAAINAISELVLNKFGEGD
ncbi:MAG: HPr family phosphocarrier protein [Nitrobacter sp.]